MRLKQNVHSTVTPLACGSQGGANLRRMMAIVVDNGHTFFAAANLEAPVDTAEFRQRRGDHLWIDAEFEPDSGRGRRVQHIVLAQDVQVKRAQVLAPVTQAEAA